MFSKENFFKFLKQITKKSKEIFFRSSNLTIAFENKKMNDKESNNCLLNEELKGWFKIFFAFIIAIMI